jgi:hypothetical protein
MDLAGVTRLTRRLLRLEKCNIRPTRTGQLLGIRGRRVWNLGTAKEIAPRPLFEIQGDCIMHRAMAEDADGNIYFGEYFMNPDRVPAKIWRIDPELENWSAVHEFDQPRIRHVHAVHSDPYQAGRLWITMGDFQDECYLAHTDDGFETVHFQGDGTQLWRSVGLIFKEDEIGWLTDTHIEQNQVVSLSRATGELTLHARRDASSWYNVETSEGLHLCTTTVEPGPGIQTDRARLLASRDGVEWEAVAEFAKDRLPMRGFGFGSLSLPAGEVSRHGFWLSGEGLVGLEGISLLCSVEDEA